MRIVSLLPSLTELVCALGRRVDLAGVTHECDFPAGVENLPHLTRSRLATAATSVEIDEQVSQQASSLYELDEHLLEALDPDLILTQEQCDVCAVNETTVRRAALRSKNRARVETVNPTDMCGVLAMFRRVAALLGTEERGEELVARFEATAREIAGRQGRDGQARRSWASPRVVLVEWLDPPYCSGHWNPEIIEFAGGAEALGRPGEKSRRITWGDIAGSGAEVILVSPCGHTLDRALDEVESLAQRPEWRGLSAVQNGRVVVTDGSAYFSRPGPRLETSLRIAAAAIDPERCAGMAPPECHGWRRVTLVS
jgi:iron complex transport system substrate-binding protein